MDKRVGPVVLDPVVIVVVLVVVLVALAIVAWRLGLNKPGTPGWRVWLFYSISGVVIAAISALLVVGLDVPILLVAVAVGVVAGALAVLVRTFVSYVDRRTRI